METRLHEFENDNLTVALKALLNQDKKNVNFCFTHFSMDKAAVKMRGHIPEYLSKWSL